MAPSAASRPRTISTRPMRGRVVACVEGVPATIKIGFEHRRRSRPPRIGDADVGEITAGVAGRDVHGPAEGDRQMREVAADRRSSHAVHRWRSWSAGRSRSRRSAGCGRGCRSPARRSQPGLVDPNSLQSNRRQGIGIAVAAGGQELQRFGPADRPTSCCCASPKLNGRVRRQPR